MASTLQGYTQGNTQGHVTVDQYGYYSISNGYGNGITSTHMHNGGSWNPGYYNLDILVESDIFEGAAHVVPTKLKGTKEVKRICTAFFTGQISGNVSYIVMHGGKFQLLFTDGEDATMFVMADWEKKIEDLITK
jgi:hypothetical protein